MSTIKPVRSAKEKAIACNTLICLLQGLIGQRATIELRNESSVTGLILDVDIYMNVSMSEVSYTGTGSGTVNLEAFYVRGKNIRFVFIPDHVSILIKCCNVKKEKVFYRVFWYFSLILSCSFCCRLTF